MSTAIAPSMTQSPPSAALPPNPRPRRRLGLAWATLGAAVLLAAGGCIHQGPDELTAGVVSGEKPFAMAGSEDYFAGAVTAKVTVGRGVGRGISKGHGERHDFAESDGRSFVGSPLPPVTLHLIITNHSPVPLTVVLVDFNSDLGNFALDPDTLTIAPGQSAEPTPMVSELGVTADSIPFKVTLKVPGKRESKTVVVRVVAMPDAPPPAK
jgi:hypothetical protein